MEEIKDLLKQRMEDVERLKEGFKRERANKLEVIKNSNLNVNAEYITKLTDKNDIIVFIEECYKCAICENSDNCNSMTPNYQPVIEYENDEYGLVYYPCGKNRGYMNSYVDIKGFDDYWKNEKRDDILKILLKGNGAYIYGGGGRGKTYTMAHVCNELNKKGKSIFFHLASYIEKTYLKQLYDFKSDDDIVEEMLKVDILVIDDFGNNSMNKKTINGLWETVIKGRFDTNKPIYFISNYTLQNVIDTIEKVSYDSVLANVINDRINTKPVFEFKDQNYRK